MPKGAQRNKKLFYNKFGPEKRTKNEMYIASFVMTLLLVHLFVPQVAIPVLGPGLAAIGVPVGAVSTWLGTLAAVPGGSPSGTSSDLGTILGGAIDKYTQTTPQAVYFHVYTAAGDAVASNVNCTGMSGVTLTSSAPIPLSGFAVIGADDYEDATDQATDFYYQKKPFEYGVVGSFIIPQVTVIQEGTPTWSGYDDGTLETTLNISIATGATKTTTELQFEASNDAAVGSPYSSDAFGLAVCFNATVASDFDEVKPKTFSGEVPIPSFMSGLNFLKCYRLPVDSKEDYDIYRFGIIIDLAASQAVTQNDLIYACPLDSSLFTDDNGDWVEGYEISSDVAADTDIGLDTLGNCKPIYLDPA